jgi:hypothetical protein
LFLGWGLIQNAKSLPEVYYGLHFSPGVAEYSEPGQEPYRILVEEQAIKNMDPTFTGKPVYVDHVDEVDLNNLQAEADGYVIESFYNQMDGKHWVKFIVVSDRAKQAIRSGWTLSNAYVPKAFSGGGLWHGVEYIKEVVAGEYEHLAIVKNPRYAESKILSPEEFKKYNGEKEIELKRLANSQDQKGEKEMKLNFFKRSKVENSIDLESTVVELPKSKKEYTIAEIVNKLDVIENMHGYASDDHMVKVGENEMSVKDLVKKHMDACNELESMKTKNAETEEGGEPGKGADDEKQNDEAADLKSVGDRGGDKSLDNKEDDKEEEKKEEAKKNAISEKVKSLKNANVAAFAAEPKPIQLSADKVARGKIRYGSN